MDGRLVPKLMTLPPTPETCQEVIHAVAPQPVKVSGAAVGGESSNALTDVCVCAFGQEEGGNVTYRLRIYFIQCIVSRGTYRYDKKYEE